MKTTAINERLVQNAAAFVVESENAYRTQIEVAAQSIFRYRAERPIILVSGPSGAGKTTTSYRLAKTLEALGAKTHTISMDDYFLPLSAEESQLAKEQKMDLESPDRLDKQLLHAQLHDFLQHKPVQVPNFNFTTNLREEGETLQLREGELVILEGIHALNPDVTGDSDEQTSRVYISARTRLKNAAGKELHPIYVRLVRRMLRDKLFRGRDVSGTLAMLDSVRRGEDRYIMPYKYRSTYDINTLLPYEMNIYKPMIEEDVARLAETDDRLLDVKNLLAELRPLSSDVVPQNSLLREFIGGSSFEY